MLKLKSQERKAILAGEHPEIVRPHTGECPFEVGEEVVLRWQKTERGPIPHLWITVTAKHRKSPTAWRAIYSIHDERGLYVAKGAGYTRSPSGSLDWQAPVLDPEAAKQYAVQARLQAAEREDNEDRSARDVAAVFKQTGRKLSSLQAEAMRYGIDLTPRISAMIGEAQRELAEKRVAQI